MTNINFDEDGLLEGPCLSCDKQYVEDIAKAFQMGLAIGFGERYDELDKVIDKNKKVIAPKTGHWIDGNNGTISCSRCGTWFYKDSRYPYMHYCPYCNVKIVESEVKDE